MEKVDFMFKKFSNLYVHMNYTCPAESIVNKIIEYDMKSAGFSVCKKYKLVSDNKIKLLEELPKKERSIYIGKMQIEDALLKRKLPQCVIIEKCNFFRFNKIQDENILSIKNDAIFIIGIKCKNTTFGDVKFIEKNVYSSYHNINGIEFFYRNKEDMLDVKGINDKIVDEHEEGMITFLKKCFKLVEYGKIKELKKYLISFSNDYKSRALPSIYYKEFNSKNQYNFINDEVILYMDKLPKKVLTEVNISYNYLFYVVPLLNRYLFQQ
jgi:hypothetical protein